jgi:hypothetical protein
MQSYTDILYLALLHYLKLLHYATLYLYIILDALLIGPVEAG